MAIGALGVASLAYSYRQTDVLSGMIGVTCFGLLFTPAFYTFIRRLGREECP
jgi:multidrug efflux pump subunit AcrB